MVQRLVAVLLLGLMTVVTATSQASVSYCLCLKTLSAGPCACAGPAKSDAPAPEAESCQDECDCCCGEEVKDNSSEESESFCGRDCRIDLALEVDAYCWSPDVRNLAKETVDEDGLAAFHPGDVSESVSEASCSLRSMRGPPDDGLPPQVPLYLRHLVFLV